MNSAYFGQPVVKKVPSRMPTANDALKVLRYVEIYGFRRTFAKVRSRSHMAATEGFAGTRWDNPKCGSPAAPQRVVGIIGCGAFSFGNIAYCLKTAQPNALRGVMDVDPARARSLALSYGAAYATTDARVIFDDPAIDLVYVASNHATHADYAVEALDAGKHVHIEKPHVVTQEQLVSLNAAMKRNPNKSVFLGFNRPHSKLFNLLRKEASRESGPSMANWFVAGHAISDDHWYFEEEEGGRILGNLCHWTDLALEMVGIENAFPCRLVPAAAVGARSDFVTSIEFGDGSLAAITFSAKGETFEGVRETLCFHRGDLLAELRDFQSVSLVRGSDRRLIRGQFRDHGHKENVLNSFYSVTLGEPGRAPDRTYVTATAQLFLAASEAHKSRAPVTIEGPPKSALGPE